MLTTAVPDSSVYLSYGRIPWRIFDVRSDYLSVGLYAKRGPCP